MAIGENHAGDTNLQISYSNIDSWSKPPRQVVKINPGAAVKEGMSAVGIVARDHQGEVLKIKASLLRADLPELAEAYGILKGLIMEKEEGWQRVCYESDAKNVVMVLNHLSTNGHHWAAEGVIKDIEEIIRSFQEVCFCWTPRKKQLCRSLYQ